MTGLSKGGLCTSFEDRSQRDVHSGFKGVARSEGSLSLFTSMLSSVMPRVTFSNKMTIPLENLISDLLSLGDLATLVSSHPDAVRRLWQLLPPCGNMCALQFSILHLSERDPWH